MLYSFLEYSKVIQLYMYIIVTIVPSFKSHNSSLRERIEPWINGCHGNKNGGAFFEDIFILEAT